MLNIQVSTLLDLDPEVRVLPAEIDEDDPTFVHEVTLQIHPYGMKEAGTNNHSWHMNLDDAERLAKALLDGVAEARRLFG